MTSHREIINAAATAIYNSESVKMFSVEHFGRGLDVHVGAYVAAIPSE